MGHDRIISNVRRHLSVERGRLQYYSKIGYRSFLNHKRDLKNSGIIDLMFRKQADFYETVVGREYHDGLTSFGSRALDTMLVWYSLVRSYRPSVVVETGVCNGVTTSFILLALEHNKNGHLYSIDFPVFATEAIDPAEFWGGKGGAMIPKGKQPGWLIPDELRERWTLHTGKSQELLPKVLSDLGDIDMFVHDSDHSHECMIFEYNAALPHLRQGGILASDDVNANNAFFEFAAHVNREPIQLYRGGGYIIV